MNIFQGLLLLPIGIAVTVLGLAVVRRHPAAPRLRESYELTGLYIAAIAAIYGILLGFMVLAVWTRFDQAEAHTEEEAATLATVARLAHALPRGPDSHRVIRACREYADQVESKEWPAMTQGRESTETHQAQDRLWEAVLRLRITAPEDAPVVSQGDQSDDRVVPFATPSSAGQSHGIPPLVVGRSNPGRAADHGNFAAFMDEEFPNTRASSIVPVAHNRLIAAGDR